MPRSRCLRRQHREHDDRHQEQRRAGGHRGPVLPALADDDRNEGRRRLRVAGGQKHREGVFVPGEDQAEDRGRRDSRRRLRQHHLHEGLKARIAVDHRRFLVLARDFVDETLEQPDRERDVDRGVEQDHPEPRIRQSDGAVHQVDRDRDRDRRHHPGRQDEEQQIVLQGHAEPREAVGRQGAERDGEHGRAEGDDQRIDEARHIVRRSGDHHVAAARDARRKAPAAVPACG